MCVDGRVRRSAGLCASRELVARPTDREKAVYGRRSMGEAEREARRSVRREPRVTTPPLPPTRRTRAVLLVIPRGAPLWTWDGWMDGWMGRRDEWTHGVGWDGVR